jgi:hypothetical protein
VIVNWNARGDLAECLQSLREQTDDEFEVVVVDNGSTDGSVKLVRQRFPGAVLVEAGENLGFAEGCNRGLAASSGAWIALLNNDAVADRYWIEQLRATARAATPRLGMIQSRILFKHRPERTNSTGVLLFRNANIVDRDFDRPRRDQDEATEVFCVSAGAALYRRQMLEEMRLPTGVFDRTFFMYYEDVDLGWRCRLAGWRALYQPAATVRHRFQGSASRHQRHFVRLQCDRNRLRALLKNGSLPFLLCCLPRVGKDVAWAAYIDGPRALAQFARALTDGVRQRAAVDRVVTTPRRVIERRWVLP